MSENIKVLYVEDDPDIRAIAEMVLEDEGFDLNICESGECALQRAPQLRPDLILLDVMMPGIDGPDTLRHLRKLPAYRCVPAVFMTAKVQTVELEEYREIGAVGVITKPFDPLTLGAQLHAFVGGAHG